MNNNRGRYDDKKNGKGTKDSLSYHSIHCVFTRITNTVLYAVGIISVIMLIYGGLRYVISGGDSKKVTDAKNTIMYAIIGLIISILAYAIVNFVINAVGGEANV